MGPGVSAFNRILINSGVCICVFLAACAPGDPVSATPMPPCVSPINGANPYYSANPQSEAWQLYTNYKNGSLTLDLARQEALAQLAKYVRQFSAYVDVALNDSQMIRITITYLDPALVEFMALNHVLLSTELINAMSTQAFSDDLVNKLSRLGDRNVLLFIVTITSPSYKAQAYNSNVLTVELPVRKMTLTSASNLATSPIYDDHVLEKDINITRGPVSGYIGFPISVMNQNDCTWVIDAQTTALTLDIPSITLGSTPINPQTWNIPFRPLIARDIVPVIVLSNPVPTFDPTMNTSNNWTPAPPTPYWNPNVNMANVDWKSYWENMGRYLWYWSMMENYH